jgi:hypothetical protein
MFWLGLLRIATLHEGIKRLILIRRRFSSADDVIFDLLDGQPRYLGIDRPGRPANKSNVDKGIQIRN